MKNTPTPTRSALRVSTLIAGLGALGFVFVPSVHADDFYWGSDTTDGPLDPAFSNWQDSTHWSTTEGSFTASGAAPTAGDNAVFSITDLNGIAQTPRLTANTSINSITFNNTTNLSLTGLSGNRDLEVGAGGLNLNGATATIGDSTNGRNVFVRVAANQTWTNNGTGALTIRNNARASDLTTGPLTLTMNAASTGNIGNSGAFADGANSTLALVVASTGTGVVSMQSSTHTGGTTVKSGILQVNGATVGNGSFQLGDTSGTLASKVRVNTTAAIITDLSVVAGSSGTKTLEFSGNTPGGTYDGDISLSDSLTLSIRAVGNGALINGDISGTGDLIKGQYLAGVSPANSGLLTLAGTNTYTGDTIIDNGAFTLSDIGSLTFSIGADGVNNQVTGTSTGAVGFEGVFNFTFGLDAFVDGNSWTIVDRSALSNVSFAATFGINGFTEVDNVWTNGSGFTFTESDGVLTYAAVPEPGSFALLAGAAVLGFGVLRRRRVA